MHSDHLTTVFATRFLGLKASRDRFLKPDGGWIPRWRFAPFTSLEDAFLVLDRAATEFKLSMHRGRTFSAEVRIDGRIGKAVGNNKARAISIAIASAMGLKCPNDDPAVREFSTRVRT
jgi:hypothetical protein